MSARAFMARVWDHTTSHRALTMMPMSLIRQTAQFALVADELLTLIAETSRHTAAWGGHIDAQALATLIDDTRADLLSSFEKANSHDRTIQPAA